MVLNLYMSQVFHCDGICDPHIILEPVCGFFVSICEAIKAFEHY